jgi:hypothetical protein
MRLATVAALAAVVVALAGAPSASSSTGPSADVENIATVVLTEVTDFEFNLYDCPFGEDMAVLDWVAEQPARPGNGAAAGGVTPFGTSSGAHTQHLTLSAGSNFVAGERWEGSGTVVCGTVLIPVSGSGTTKSVNGV